MTPKPMFVEVVLVLAAVCLLTNTLMAETITIKPERTISIEGHSPAEVEAACDGYFGSPNKRGTYFCQNTDGSGISCGGLTEDQKSTCDTFKLSPDNSIVKKTLATQSLLADDLDEAGAPRSQRCHRCDGDICC